MEKILLNLMSRSEAIQIGAGVIPRGEAAVIPANLGLLCPSDPCRGRAAVLSEEPAAG